MDKELKNKAAAMLAAASNLPYSFLAAAGGAAAFHAAVAGAVAGHDGSAGGAGGGVAHVVHLFHGRGGVDVAAVGDSQCRSLHSAFGSGRDDRAWEAGARGEVRGDSLLRGAAVVQLFGG